MTLQIARGCYEDLRRHGEQTYPAECCGILIGEFTDAGRFVRQISACGNTRTDSLHNRYHIDPAELFRAQRKAADEGTEIVGFYHSHPDHPARWSPTDLAEAHWTGCSYVITSVEKGKASRTASFVLTGDEQSKQFEDEGITIID